MRGTFRKFLYRAAVIDSLAVYYKKTVIVHLFFNVDVLFAFADTRI